MRDTLRLMARVLNVFLKLVTIGMVALSVASPVRVKTA